LSIHERLICSEELGNRHQTPTLIGCMLLTIHRYSDQLAASLFACLAAISEALNYDRFFEALSSCSCCFLSRSAAFAAVAVVISEALDSIPTFDRLSRPKALFFPPLPLLLSQRRRQRSPRL
jgi:hypothetical protein